MATNQPSPKPLPKYIEDFAIDCGAAPSRVEQLLNNYFTCDPDTIRLKDKVKLLAKPACNIPVLIVGETGVGKELIARALHADRSGKFVAVNCAGVPDNLLESEFFGSTHGAFTGAIARAGYLEEAMNGTLFLDEIGDMPLLLQSKLLRVLQEKVSRRLGATNDYKITCRFVSATNKSKLELQTTKTFRQDLFHRLAGVCLEIKPLRERIEDVKLLVQRLSGYEDPVTITSIADKFRSMECYGNVRGLQNLIEDYKIEQQLTGPTIQITS